MTLSLWRYDNYAGHPRRTILAVEIRRLGKGERGLGSSASRRVYVFRLDCEHTVERRGRKEPGDTCRCDVCPHTLRK